MNLDQFPDFVAVTLLTWAFGAVAHRSRAPVSRLWLGAWLLIVFQLAAHLLAESHMPWHRAAATASLALEASAGILFGYASVPYRRHASSQWMTIALIATTSLYAVALTYAESERWLLAASAALVGIVPLSIAVATLRSIRHPLRWMIVSLHAALGLYLAAVQNTPTIGPVLASNGMLLIIYFGCALHFAYQFNRKSIGTLTTMIGFLAWAGTYAAQLLAAAGWETLALAPPAWNVPKYLVAAGMILLTLEEQLNQSRYLALHDELTGLPNRRLFLDRLEKSMERARRARQKAALLVIDLDHFKLVNDTLGHHAGDELLRKVARAFTARVRAADTVARTGGDEFSVILENPCDATSAQQVAHCLLEHLHVPMKIGGKTVCVGASIGVAMFPDDAETLESLQIAADLQMYRNKNMGRTVTNGEGTVTMMPEPVQQERGQQLAAEMRVRRGGSRA